jgi:hypothetical protein
MMQPPVQCKAIRASLECSRWLWLQPRHGRQQQCIGAETPEWCMYLPHPGAFHGPAIPLTLNKLLVAVIFMFVTIPTHCRFGGACYQGYVGTISAPGVTRCYRPVVLTPSSNVKLVDQRDSSCKLQLNADSSRGAAGRHHPRGPRQGVRVQEICRIAMLNLPR